MRCLKDKNARTDEDNPNPSYLSPKRNESNNNRKSWISPSRGSPSKRMSMMEFNQRETELDQYKNDVINKSSEIQNLKVK